MGLWARRLVVTLGALAASEEGMPGTGRTVVVAQLAVGAGLILLGAFLGSYADGSDSLAFTLIALGAMILPPGAAAAAGTRIQRTRRKEPSSGPP